MESTQPSAEAGTDGLIDALSEAMAADARASDASPQSPPAISLDRFEALAREAAAGMGGVLLFSICVGPDEARRHVATARLGGARAQEFVILSMAASGGPLTAEPAATSADPVARIAAAYAGLADMLDAAA